MFQFRQCEQCSLWHFSKAFSFRRLLFAFSQLFSKPPDHHREQNVAHGASVSFFVSSFFGAKEKNECNASGGAGLFWSSLTVVLRLLSYLHESPGEYSAASRTLFHPLRVKIRRAYFQLLCGTSSSSNDSIKRFCHTTSLSNDDVMKRNCWRRQFFIAERRTSANLE